MYWSGVICNTLANMHGVYIYIIQTNNNWVFMMYMYIIQAARRFTMDIKKCKCTSIIGLSVYCSIC